MKIAVGQGSCGIAAGAQKAYEVLESTLNLNNNQLTVTGCIGMCYLEPIVDVYAEDGLHRFVKVNGEIAEKIANAINNNDLLSVKEYEINDDDKQFLDKQKESNIKADPNKATKKEQTFLLVLVVNVKIQ